MCAIVGASFVPGSTINRRKLTAALLKRGQVRGTDAAGYAWTGPSGAGLYKKNVPGSMLNMTALPQDADSIIAHTRAGTKGTARDNENNHPLQSTDGSITLIHNGVIYNDMAVRRTLGKSAKKLAEVDSAVIPEVISELGLSEVDIMEGYAACAWFDTETGPTIHLARFESAPVHYAWLEDGSFAFASTGDILGQALNDAGIAWYGHYPSAFASLNEKDYWQIAYGEVMNESTVRWSKRSTQYDSLYKQYSKTTDGGKSAITATASSPLVVATVDESEDYGLSDAPKTDRGKQVVAAGGWVMSDDYEEDLFDRSGYYLGSVTLDTPAVLDDTEPEQKAKHKNKAAITAKPNAGPTKSAQFYCIDHSGDYQDFTTLEGLVACLDWNAKRTDGERITEDGDALWANFFQEIGEIEEDGTLVSWIDNPDAAAEYASDEDNMKWVSAGASVLRRVLA